MRQVILAANWKMHKTREETRAFAADFLPRISDASAELVIAPPFTALPILAEALAGSPVRWAAQNVHPEPGGAFTGEISVGMLVELGCSYAIVGHSERRALFGETDAFVAAKACALLAADLRPILCVGESLAQREAGQAFDTVGSQLAGSLAGVPVERAEDVVIAYEPVWAIGTGKTATPEIAQEMHAFVREQLAGRFGDAASRMRIQYGGSVKPDNAASLLSQPDIDGALVGGASLEGESFAGIVHNGRHAA